MFFDSIREDALADPDLRQSALVNTKENFGYVFKKVLEDFFIDRMEQNEEITAKFLNEKEFRDIVSQNLLEQVYEQIRSEDQQVHTLSNDVFGLLGDCNNIYASKAKAEIFRLTNRMLKRMADVGKPAKTKDDFGNLIDALYEIIYEGSGNLKRIPEDFKREDFIGFTIKFLRTDLRHDLEHGKEKEIRKKKMRLAKIYQHYTTKTTISSLETVDFPKFQIKILRELKSFLANLKQYCIKQD